MLNMKISVSQLYFQKKKKEKRLSAKINYKTIFDYSMLQT